MIKSFASGETPKLFNHAVSRKLPNEIQRTALRKLYILDGAEALSDLRIPPANRLEKLPGTRTGQYSIRINSQWRICFAWQAGNAYAVEIIDYH